MAKNFDPVSVCESGLHVSELTCGRCRTRIAGQFDPCRFCSLAAEHLAFLETFLRCERQPEPGGEGSGDLLSDGTQPLYRHADGAWLWRCPGSAGAQGRERLCVAYTTGTSASPPAPPTPPTPSSPETVARRLAILDALGRGEIRRGRGRNGAERSLSPSCRR